MHQVDPGHHLEQLARHMGGSSDTARRHGDLARIGLGIGDELGNCFGWNRWMHRYDVRLPVNACDRRDVADEIETELVIERGVDRVPTADYEQRVAVRRCAHDRLGADIAARAWSILDDERLTEPLRQPLTDQARDDVSWAAGGKTDNDAHGPAWIGLRPCNAGYGRQR